jgi:hypothetical protein
MQSEVKMTPEPLSTTPRLSTQNGTAEAFVFLQALAAGGRRHARVSSLDLQLLDAQRTHLETLRTVFSQIPTHLTKLAAAQRDYSQAFKASKLIFAANAKLLVTFP